MDDPMIEANRTVEKVIEKAIADLRAAREELVRERTRIDAEIDRLRAMKRRAAKSKLITTNAYR